MAMYKIKKQSYKKGKKECTGENKLKKIQLPENIAPKRELEPGISGGFGAHKDVGTKSKKTELLAGVVAGKTSCPLSQAWGAAPRC